MDPVAAGSLERVQLETGTITAGRGSSRQQGGRTPMPEDERPERLALVEERLEIGKRQVERGRVVVRTRVDTREELAEAELRQEEVSVERVSVGHPVETPPPVREEDGVLIVPVLEEQLVVTTRLVLKEELRITKKSRTETVREPVRLRSERAEVTRLTGHEPDHPGPEEGDPVDG